MTAMVYDVAEKNAVTRRGVKAVFKRFDNATWPAPWVFEVEGHERHYSIGGFFANHQMPEHDLDLVADWIDEVEYDDGAAAVLAACIDE